MRARFYFERELCESNILFFISKGWAVEWNRFSELVAGAKDQFKLSIEKENWVSISGVVGGKEIDVFWGRPGNIDQSFDSNVISEFENVIIQSGLATKFYWKDTTSVAT